MDTVASVGPEEFRAHVGYLYSAPSPYLTPYQERSEVGIGFSSKVGNWRMAGSTRRDIETRHMVRTDFAIGYEDECFILEARFLKRFAENPATGTLYPSNTILLLRVGLKTIGDFGFRAI